jgi:hypothetical protein
MELEKKLALLNSANAVSVTVQASKFYTELNTVNDVLALMVTGASKDEKLNRWGFKSLRP